MIENLERKETLEKRPLVIGLVGCIASGKTTLSEELGRRWGTKPTEEDYPANPFLKDFYDNLSEHGYNEYSFKSQTFFLTSKIQLLKTIDRSKVSLLDPELPMDYIYAHTHFKMDWMDKGEWNLYQDLFNTYTHPYEDGDRDREKLVYSDMHIIVMANQSDLEQRIIKRNREYEMRILEKCPKYLTRLSESVSEWGQLKENGTYKLPINTSLPGSLFDNVQYLADRIESHICREFGGSGKFKLPNITPPELSVNFDHTPGLGSMAARLHR
jgi:deoxyadenosine/deoxycytidine kinase